MRVLKIETNLPDNEDLVISKVGKGSESVPTYSCIGGNMDYKTRTKGHPELFSILKNVSKIGTWFFWSLMEERKSKTNEAIFRAKDPSESRKISRAYKELYSLDLVRRVKQQHYLINPKVMLPAKGQYSAVLVNWENISRERSK
jgi:hypothetical protein